MSKDDKQFDILQGFLEDNQDVFLKNYKKNIDDKWDSFYDPLMPEQKDELLKEDEGQLAVDVYQKGDNIIIQATIAGIDPDKLDISLHNDILTIRGERKQVSEVDEEDYFYKECYWGRFSRSIILPLEVKSEDISASIKNGVLQIILPKSNPKSKIKIKVIDEDE